jgi:hypothetical protein
MMSPVITNKNVYVCEIFIKITEVEKEALLPSYCSSFFNPFQLVPTLNHVITNSFFLQWNKCCNNVNVPGFMSSTFNIQQIILFYLLG